MNVDQPLQRTLAWLAQEIDARADALDRLILADTFGAADPASGGLPANPQDRGASCILISEDTTGALLLGAVRHTLQSSSQDQAPVPDQTPVIAVRNRSFAQTRAQLVLADSLMAKLASEHDEHVGSVHVPRIIVAGEDSLDPRALLSDPTIQSAPLTIVLGRMPKSHGALHDLAHACASHQAQRVVLGGNQKHMHRSFNDTLATYFSQVRGLRGKGKHRCIEATGARVPVPSLPSTDGSLQAFGGVFAGDTPDRGGMLLAKAAQAHIARLAQGSDVATVLDLGCGNGAVLRWLQDSLAVGVEGSAGGEPPALRWIGTDIDADAVRTAQANLPGMTITWDDAGQALPAHSVDVLLLNPPFHDGTRVDLTLIQPLLDAAQRLLKPGGVLYLVHNSHARYRPEVQARFRTVSQVVRNSTFTVLQASA